MGENVATVGDSVAGTCTAHPTPISTTGTISAGSGSVNAEGNPVARIGDPVSLACGHSAEIIEGSSTVKANGIPLSRKGDAVGGPTFTGTITSGCSNTNSG